MSNITFSDIDACLRNITLEFANGYGLSISIGSGTYSGANTAEIAVLKDGAFVRIGGQDDDVIGWVSADTIASISFWVARGDLGAVKDAIDACSRRLQRVGYFQSSRKNTE